MLLNLRRNQMPKILAFTFLTVALAGCGLVQWAQTGVPPTPAQIQQDAATAASLLKAAGCDVSVLSAAAAPIIQVAVDDQGNKIAKAVDATGTAVCVVPTPGLTSPAGTALPVAAPAAPTS